MNSLLKNGFYAMMGAAAALGFASCSDDNTGGSSNEATNAEIQAIATQYLDATVNPTYTLLANGTDTLYNKLDSLRQVAWAGGTITPEAMRDVAGVFLRARANYELSEAFLFGAASDFGIDPHIDSWPLDLEALQTALKNTDVIESLREDDGTSAGTNLPTSVLGFHGIEYVLFRDGQVRTDLNQPDAGLNNLDGRLELTYAAAVAGDLRNSCVQMEVSWNPNASEEHKQLIEDLGVAHTVPNGLTYSENMLNAGKAGSTYSDWVKVLNDILIAGCQNICNEVGDVKIGVPHGSSSSEGYDPDYIESPYSYNSITDFAHNIESIENAIMGGRRENRDESKSIYNYLNQRNPEMAAELKTKIATAISAIQNMTYPFVHNTEAGQNNGKVATAIAACNDLNSYLITVDEYIRSNY